MLSGQQNYTWRRSLNTNKLQVRTGFMGDLTINGGSLTTFDISFEKFPHDCHIVIPIARGGVKFSVWINTMNNGSAQIAAINSGGGQLVGRAIQWIAIGD